ncbi:MAG TPA: ABC transporter permease subunit [Acidimicrobiales bacterium]|jgi:ABC-2 type transport system permease protein|nr:ABC transporter permease subunit [Acidimicrobiales bacterium]
MIKVEWIRQVRRARTWACLGGLALVPILFTIASYVDPPRQRRELNIFTLLTASGLNVGIVSLYFMSQFFLIVVVAAFAGESVSGEATWGTLRYLLVRPVSRTRLILAKFGVAYVLTVLAVVVIIGAGLGAGTIAFGWHDALIIDEGFVFPIPIRIAAGEMFWRLLFGAGYVALTMLVVVAIGILLSTLTDSTAAAVVGTVVVIVTSQVLSQVPGLESIKPLFPTRYWDEWRNLYSTTGLQDMWKGAASAVAWSSLITLIALWRFRRKDILS